MKTEDPATVKGPDRKIGAFFVTLRLCVSAAPASDPIRSCAGGSILSLGCAAPSAIRCPRPARPHPAWDFPLRSRPSSIVGRRHVTRRYSITATRLGVAVGSLTQLWLKHDAQSDAHFTHLSPGHSPSLTTVRSSGADPSPCAGRGRSAIIAFPRAPSILKPRGKGKPVRMTDSDCRKS